MNDGATVEIWAWMAGAAVVNVLWQGAIVGGLGWLALHMMPRASAQTRYVIACGAIVAMAALLPLNLIGMDSPPKALLQNTDAPLPYLLPPLPVEPIQSMESATPQEFLGSALKTNVASQNIQAATESARPFSENLDAPQERAPREEIDWYDHALPWVGKAWCIGVLAFVLYDLLGLWKIGTLRKHSYTAPSPIIDAVQKISSQIGLKTNVSVRIADGISTALVTGFFRVVILLPASMATGMAPEYVEAILAHELAHVRRWDRWFNLLQRFIEAALFFHPFVWWLSRIARAERELCCDEIAVQFCPDRSSYVRALLELSFADSSGALTLSSHSGGLAFRVRHILNPDGVPRQVGRPAAILLSISLAAALVGIALYARIASAATLPERVLRFPNHQNSGAIYGRWINEDYRTLPWMPDHDEGWTLLALARGDVKIPADTLVRLSVGGPNLDYLRTLKPDDIYFLDASLKELSDSELAPIAHLSGLRALDLSGNGNAMTGTVLADFSVLSELEWLDLRGTNVDAMPEGSLAALTNLRHLAGHFGLQTDNALRASAAMPNLEFLWLKRGEVSADAIGSINHHQSIRGLSLDNVGFNDDMLSRLDDLPSLIYLNLRQNQVTDVALEHIGIYNRLKSLDLDRTAITDIGLAHLHGNAILEHLYVSNTQVTEDCLGVLASLPSLTLVSLFRTEVDEVTVGAFMTALLSRTEGFSRPQQSTDVEAPKVGLVFSHATASSPHITTEQSGYALQQSMELARALDKANYDVYAVIEPGSEILGELPWLLQNLGLGEKAINGFDSGELAKLDTVIAASLYDCPLPMLDAIAEAVEGGMGLVNIGALGTAAPGERHFAVERLTGLEDSAIYWQPPRAITCPVVQSHPILGPLKPGDVFVLDRLNGCISDSGKLDGTILIDAPPNNPEVYPVLYTRTLGEGRIVRAQWFRPFHAGIPFPGFSFYVRCINWAAHRDADTIW